MSSSYSVAEDAGFEALVCENGWRVRQLVEQQNEMRKVARVQAEAFHEPVFFMDDLFFQFFEVSSLHSSFFLLLYKMRIFHIAIESGITHKEIIHYNCPSTLKRPLKMNH